MPSIFRLAFSLVHPQSPTLQSQALINPIQCRRLPESPPPLTILDLTGVPYMDSAGMGVVNNFHVHCQNKGGRFVAAGVSPRILELFRMTRVDSVIRMTATSEEVEALA